MHASKAMAGDTKNGQHEQVHHRQTMMSMHSLHADDPGYSQTVMDRSMNGQPKSVTIRTWRERQQRWLVNQRYAQQILAMLAFSTGFGVVCLIAWALYFANNSRSSWKARVGKEVATWLSMPAIILGVHFEAELGDYFEPVYAWHNRTGPHNPRSGFRMMEIHNLYFDFELPWWNSAYDTPRLQLPNTMKYLETNFSGDDYEMRLDLIKRGLKLGREELIKITRKYLFQVPILLLVMCNEKRGPAFLRAVLSVLHENAERVSPQVLIHQVDDVEKWGTFRYENPADRPPDERAWYDLLAKSDEAIDDLIHWWRQLCLNYEVLIEDLQNLSKVDTGNETKAGEGAPLNKFKTNYPVLFDCLYSVFGTMLSNSRLCEQIHGMMRHALRSEIGMEQADHQRIYSSGIDHEMKEERRWMEDDADEYREKHKKAKTHSRTKPQQVRLSQQICERADKFADMVREVDYTGLIPSLDEIGRRGRRVMDKDNLDHQMMEEDERAGRLRRKHLTAEDATAMAGQTEMTNDVTYVADAALVLWHERVPQLLKKKFWDVPAGEMKEKFDVAAQVFVHWPHDNIDPGKVKTKKAMESLIKGHIDWVDSTHKKIMEFVGDDVNKGVHESDIKSMFVRPVPCAFGDEIVMEPVEAALVKTCMAVDAHYIINKTENGDSDDESDDEYMTGYDIEAESESYTPVNPC